MHLRPRSSLAVLPLVILACSSPSGSQTGAASSPATSASELSRSRAPRNAGALRASLERRFGGPRNRPAAARPASSDDAGVPQPGDHCVQPNGPVPRRYQGLVTAFQQDLSDNAPGAAMAILEHGHLAFSYGLGTKGTNTTAPVCPSTLFRIGSMTKALTATALLHVVDQGETSLSAKLVDVAPDVALPAGTDLSRLTLAQLLDQTSGLYDILGTIGIAGGPTDDAYLSKYLTSKAFHDAMYFMNPPGSFWNYSSTNYMLAGLAIERASQLEYPDAMRRFVTRPLAMDRSTFSPSQVVADGDYTNGTSLNPDGSTLDIAPVGTDNAAIRPAGMLFSSVLDFAKFAEFMFAGNPAVLSDATRLKMRSPIVSTELNGTVDHYGYGVYSDPGSDFGPGQYFPGKMLAHSGGQPGWTSFWTLNVEDGFGFIVFQNDDIGPGFDKTLLYAIENLEGLAPEAEPQSTQPDPSLYPSYAGTYYDPEQLGTVVVTAANGALTVDLPDLAALGYTFSPTLVPTTRDNFTLTVAGFPLVVTFVRDATGKFEWLRGFDFNVAQREAPDGGTP